MRSGYLRYFVGFIITLGLIIALIILLFSGGNNSKKSVSQPLLSSYAATNATVLMTIDGPITAPQNHTQIRVSVNRNNATFQQLVGYDGAVVNAKSYSNTSNSYGAFLRAIMRAGFSLGNTNPTISDPTGYCPLGNVYHFELINEGVVLQNFWTTSCGSPKTYKGNTDLTISLFRSQIPDYGTLTQNIDL